MPTQDELIQAELDGTIEQLEARVADEQTVEQPTEEVAEPVVEQVVNEEVKEEVKQEIAKPEPDTTTKKTDSVAKLLKQRNEARAEVESLRAQIQNTTELETRLKELEESIASQELEKEAQKEKESFYSQYPNAKGHEEGIEKLRESKDLSYSEAFQLYAAQNDPTLLMDEQYRNKSTSGATLTGVARVNSYDRTNPSEDDFDRMSDDEFLAWSNGKAKTDRMARGFLK